MLIGNIGKYLIWYIRLYILFWSDHFSRNICSLFPTVTLNGVIYSIYLGIDLFAGVVLDKINDLLADRRWLIGESNWSLKRLGHICESWYWIISERSIINRCNRVRVWILILEGRKIHFRPIIIFIFGKLYNRFLNKSLKLSVLT